MADLDDPRFWQRLYSPPEDSNTGSHDSSSSLEFELGDLDATLSPDAPADDALPVDSAALSALVERLVAERLAQMGASGGLSESKRSTARPPPRRAVTSPGIRVPPRRQAPASHPSMRTIERPGRPDKSPPPPPPPKRTKPTLAGPPASLTPDGPSTPRPAPIVKTPPRPSPPGRPSRAAPGPGTTGSMRAAPPPSPPTNGSVHAAPPPSPPNNGSVRAAPPPSPPTTGSMRAAPPPTNGKAKGKSKAAPRSSREGRATPASSGKVKAAPSTPDALMWEKIPSLVGGPAALLKAENLSQDAVSVMVMVNGTTSLGGLRTLVPQLDDRAFLTIIRDGVSQGVLTLE